MANDGDISITTGDTTYVFNYGSNSACRLEDELNDGRSYTEVMDELTGPKPRVKTIRAFVKAALVSHKDMTLEQVGDVIDQLGGWALILVGLDSQSPYALKAKTSLESLQKLLNTQEAEAEPKPARVRRAK